MNSERAITIESGGLQLEGALREGDGALAALVLHPHPQYGGDMNNHVVMAACETLASLGAATLRFNFRGTGGSDGSFDNGRGESDDARAAAAALRASNTGTKFALVGYSFGAMIAANVAAELRPDALVLISPPVGMVELPLPDAMTPTLVIAGDRDQISPSAAVRALEGPGRTIVIASGIDHSWWPGLDVLQEALRAFVEKNVATAAPLPSREGAGD